MPPRSRWVLATLSLSLLFLVAVPIVRELSRPSDIWWTPHAMLVPLSESGDRVEIYARGKPLTALLQAGQLRFVGEGEVSPLAMSDVGLRFDNWDRVRVERLPLLLLDAAVCGVIACMLLLVLTGRLAYRGERERRTA